MQSQISTAPPRAAIAGACPCSGTAHHRPFETSEGRALACPPRRPHHRAKLTTPTHAPVQPSAQKTFLDPVLVRAVRRLQLRSP
jgi:hypothetical protein